MEHEKQTSVQVVLRVRPLLPFEQQDDANQRTPIAYPAPDTISIANTSAKPKAFTFDQVFDQNSSQEDLYTRVCKGLVTSWLSGYNVCMFAYGQTGSGKTHTLGISESSLACLPSRTVTESLSAGVQDISLAVQHLNNSNDCEDGTEQADSARDMTDHGSDVSCHDSTSPQQTLQGLFQDPEIIGIIPRAFTDMINGMSSLSDATIEMSLIEVHNKDINDLLSTNTTSSLPVSIRETQTGEIQLLNASRVTISSVESMLGYLRRGIQLRTTASTKMNQSSSRSHCVLTLHLTQRMSSSDDPSSDSGGFISSKFNFVDLAGSERIKKTHAEGKRLQEGISINSGLHHLGICISTLADPNFDPKKTFVPYRNSVITRLLQDSLGGNSRTVMIACVSPAYTNVDETLSTLHFASQAKRIKNSPVINLDPVTIKLRQQQQTIVTLTRRIELLESILHSHNVDFPSSSAATKESTGFDTLSSSLMLSSHQGQPSALTMASADATKFQLQQDQLQLLQSQRDQLLEKLSYFEAVYRQEKQQLQQFIESIQAREDQIQKQLASQQDTITALHNRHKDSKTASLELCTNISTLIQDLLSPSTTTEPHTMQDTDHDGDDGDVSGAPEQNDDSNSADGADILQTSSLPSSVIDKLSQVMAFLEQFKEAASQQFQSGDQETASTRCLHHTSSTSPSSAPITMPDDHHSDGSEDGSRTEASSHIEEMPPNHITQSLNDITSQFLSPQMTTNENNQPTGGQILDECDAIFGLRNGKKVYHHAGQPIGATSTAVSRSTLSSSSSLPSQQNKPTGSIRGKNPSGPRRQNLRRSNPSPKAITYLPQFGPQLQEMEDVVNKYSQDYITDQTTTQRVSDDINSVVDKHHMANNEAILYESRIQELMNSVNNLTKERDLFRKQVRSLHRLQPKARKTSSLGTDASTTNVSSSSLGTASVSLATCTGSYSKQLSQITTEDIKQVESYYKQQLKDVHLQLRDYKTKLVQADQVKRECDRNLQTVKELTSRLTKLNNERNRRYLQYEQQIKKLLKTLRDKDALCNNLNRKVFRSEARCGRLQSQLEQSQRVLRRYLQTKRAKRSLTTLDYNPLALFNSNGLEHDQYNNRYCLSGPIPHYMLSKGTNPSNRRTTRQQSSMPHTNPGKRTLSYGLHSSAGYQHRRNQIYSRGGPSAIPMKQVPLNPSPTNQFSHLVPPPTPAAGTASANGGVAGSVTSGNFTFGTSTTPQNSIPNSTARSHQSLPAKPILSTTRPDALGKPADNTHHNTMLPPTHPQRNITSSHKAQPQGSLPQSLGKPLAIHDSATPPEETTNSNHNESQATIIQSSTAELDAIPHAVMAELASPTKRRRSNNRYSSSSSSSGSQNDGTTSHNADQHQQHLTDSVTPIAGLEETLETMFVSLGSPTARRETMTDDDSNCLEDSSTPQMLPDAPQQKARLMAPLSIAKPSRSSQVGGVSHVKPTLNIDPATADAEMSQSSIDTARSQPKTGPSPLNATTSANNTPGNTNDDWMRNLDDQLSMFQSTLTTLGGPTPSSSTSRLSIVKPTTTGPAAKTQQTRKDASLSRKRKQSEPLQNTTSSVGQNQSTIMPTAVQTTYQPRIATRSSILPSSNQAGHAVPHYQLPTVSSRNHKSLQQHDSNQTAMQDATPPHAPLQTPQNPKSTRVLRPKATNTMHIQAPSDGNKSLPHGNAGNPLNNRRSILTNHHTKAAHAMEPDENMHP